MSGRRRIKHNDGRSRSQALTEKRLTPSDIRRREARKIERTELAKQGLLPAQRPTFRCFVNRLDPVDAVFESPNSQVDLNRALCMSSIDTVPIEFSRNRLAVESSFMEAFAAELVAKGWVRL
jgi:hypothetical protein